jgi:hypothetical protein
MSSTEDLLRLEHAGWEALSTSGEAAASFYEEILATRVIFVLPGGIVLDDRDAVISSMSGAPWDAFEISEERVEHITPDCAAVVYRASARRGGHSYQAWFNSTYVVEHEGWRLALHQQTP